MKEFCTLRGFVAGEEDAVVPSMECSAILRIRGEHELDFQEISESLGVQPTTVARRGERRGTRGPASKCDLWMYQPPTPKSEELYRHIDGLWAVLKPHREYLLALKSRVTVDVFLTYSSNIDHGGVSIPPRSLEMFLELEVDLGISIVVLPD